MPVHNFRQPRGRIAQLTIDSEALRGNLLGDPSRRTVAVYLPPGHDTSREDHPLLVDLTGFTGSGLKHLAWQPFGESVPQRIDRLVDQGKLGPVVVAFPDCFTTLGGNQYIDSIALGRWEEFLLEEMLPAIEQEFRVRPGSRHRAVFGKSSGGYGAILQGLRRGDRWAGVACHSGDMAFELVYLPEFPRTLDVLARHGGSVTAFLDHLRVAPKIGSDEMCALMILAMAATYDPDPAAPFGIRLPVDPRTCELDPERWARWLAHDPVRLVELEECRQSLGRLRALYLDCGSRDQYHLHYGARAFARKLERSGVVHRYEEFDDDHTGIDYRLDVSLPYLYEAVSS
jgi:S-formylglutathione hydrolase FrmB